MTSPQCCIVKQQIEGVLSHLEHFLPLTNCHTVDYFTKSLYEQLVPKQIQEEVKGIGCKNALNDIFNDKINERTPYLNEFLVKCKRFSLYNLKNVCLDINQFREVLSRFGCSKIEGLKLEVFMNPKKSHEVEILSAVAAALREIKKTTHVIDIGDGKGYLSSMLALHHKIPVLGIDSSFINTTSAVKRVEKLGKIWHGLVKDSKRSVLTKKEEKLNLNSDLYKQVTQFVSKETDLKQLADDVFMENCDKLSLVGLHTCGNLAPASIRIFKDNAYVKTICNVSCCYHLITERDLGFPMSDFLSKKGFRLSFNTRMLSAQSVDRLLHKKEHPNNTIFYRAVFQELLVKHCGTFPERNVGRFKKECVSFADYARKAVNRIEADVDLEDFEGFFEEYAHRQTEMNFFIMLRSMLAPAIETVILLDRLLYMYEQGIENSFLVRLFDPIISPRCYGLVAFKE